MATELDTIVRDIISKCDSNDVAVSEPLAAFVARTLVEKDSSCFCMERQLNDQDITSLIQRCVDFLQQKNCVALETIKMQLDFDLSYVQFEEDITKNANIKEKRLRYLQRSIIGLQPTDSTDLETLTTLYKQIFSLLMVHENAESLNSREAEREVAAALESVFPRIGLKAFLAVSADEKKTQLIELCGIVHGIRLFNREIGKGGAALDLTISNVQSIVDDLQHTVGSEIQRTSDKSNDYTEVLMYLHYYKPDGVSDIETQQWKDELANRRQFMCCLQSLQEDISVSAQKVETLVASFEQQMKDLKLTVGSRTSVPKEVVYPMFEGLSKTWIQIEAEHEILQSRLKSCKVLMDFKTSYISGNTTNALQQWISKARDAGALTPDVLVEPSTSLQMSSSTSDIISQRRTSGLQNRSTENMLAADAKESEGASAVLDAKLSDVPVRLSVESTPEFMQLPLEYQGFCPYTIVTHNGLLLPGDPSIGVVRYQDTFNVFVNEQALESFFQEPELFSNGVVKLAMEKPQLIHLLRMQDSFPEASLASLVQAGSDAHSLAAPSEVKMVDASTGTPTHFIEKNIDFNYEWNEWSLRRKALRLANLRKCTTISTQTGLSNFRKEIDTQVYLPGNRGTQTATSQGTNPQKTVTYLAGLRGTQKKSSSKYAEGDDTAEAKTQARPAVVTLKYDL